MAPPSPGRSPDVLRSSDRNAATEALSGVAPGYRDTLVNLLCRDIDETANRFGAACSELIRRDERKKKRCYKLLDQIREATPIMVGSTLITRFHSPIITTQT
jgi:hypothetical protein